MDMDFDDGVLRALHGYVGQVSEALGLRGESWYVQADDVACAYIALERRLDRFPNRDLALLWDDNRGWSAAIETHSGEDLLVVDRFGREVLPRPAAVAAWVEGLFDRTGGGRAPDEEPPFPDDGADLTVRLAAYAIPVAVDTRPFGSSLMDAGTGRSRS